MQPRDRFHAHLDECARCEENPFGLCATGADALAAAVEELPLMLALWRGAETQCNRNGCRDAGATWWNSSTRRFYCRRCARLINQHAPGLCFDAGARRVPPAPDGTRDGERS
jgi:hypothetical protein